KTVDIASCNILRVELVSFYELKKVYLDEVRREYLTKSEITKTRILEVVCQLFSIDISTYYRRRKKCLKCNDNVYRIAKSLRRSDFSESRQELSVRHFIDRCIMRYETSCVDTYKFIDSLWQRNKRYWIDVGKHDNIHEELVELILGQKVPIDVLLNNPEYRS